MNDDFIEDGQWGDSGGNSPTPTGSSDQPTSSTGAPTPELLREALRQVVDPELHMNIVDLGLVYDVSLDGAKAVVQMTLTSPGCPYGPYILHDVDQALKGVSGIEDTDVQVVWEPAWGPHMMSEEMRLELGFDI